VIHIRAVLLLAVLTGCAVGPDYQRPEVSTPDAWHQDLVGGLATGETSLGSWWTVFDDPILIGLIERASEGSHDVRAAVARIAEAQARRGIASGDLFPAIDTNTLYEYTDPSDKVSGDLKSSNFYSAGLGAAWEVDLFGRVRRSVEATEADFQASLELYRDVLVVLYASVATSYVEVRSLQKRIRYAKSNIETQAETLELVRVRNRAGLVGDLDLREAELNLARTESVLPQLRQALTAAVNRVGVLVGEYPSALHAELREPREIPLLPHQVLVGLPRDLLRQRPDLRQAERGLAAQTARIGVATADLYPRLTLLGSFSFDASSSGDWFSAAAQSLSLGPQLRWNVFDGGSIRSNIRVQDALAEQALVRYEQAVLEAVEEVENALASYVYESERLDALRRSTEAALQAVELVKTQYLLGIVDFQNVLDEERTLFEEQDRLATSEGRETQNLIQVYRALGGGW
jgi:NodT family efflux transporter outer membrane factor (OMF) lipoprotein